MILVIVKCMMGGLKFSKKDFHHASRPGDILKDQRPGWIRKTWSEFSFSVQENSHTGLHYKSTQLLHELKAERELKGGEWTLQLYPNYLSALKDLGETERSFPQFLAPNSDAKPDNDWILD
jgi:hypothetical protein